MQVTVNNKEFSIPQNYTMIDLLELLNYNKSVAVFVNDTQLMLSEYVKHMVSEKDNIRIIKPLGGG